jgi:hypothetical protein
MRTAIVKLMPCQAFKVAYNAQSDPEQTNFALSNSKQRRVVTRFWWSGSSPTGS